MWIASEKAKENSIEYNRLEGLVEKEAREHCQNRKITRPKTVLRIINQFKEDDNRLKKAYNRYNFWRGEQIRLSTSIIAENAFQSLISSTRDRLHTTLDVPPDQW